MKNIDKLIPDREQQELLRSLIETEYEGCLGSIEKVNELDDSGDDLLVEYKQDMLNYYQRLVGWLREIYRRLYSRDICN